MRHYIEPFYGSGAMLLGRELRADGTVPSDSADIVGIETVNDLNGFLVNFWRAVALMPEVTAGWADWPVSEIDLFARHMWLVRTARQRNLQALLENDPLYCDPQIAGWWVWGMGAWLGGEWCSGNGPWTTDVDGKIVRIDGGRDGIGRRIPHLSGAGQGINRKIPAIGTSRGVHRQLPHLANTSRGVNGPGRTEQLIGYFQALAERTRHVRFVCGDWKRVLTPAITGAARGGPVGIFLDPPYGEGEMDYAVGSTDGTGGNADKTVAMEVWEWAKANGANPQFRIIVCGYDDGRAIPAGWTVVKWKARKGYAMTEAARANTGRERLWCSPACLAPEQTFFHLLDGAGVSAQAEGGVTVVEIEDEPQEVRRAA